MKKGIYFSLQFPWCGMGMLRHSWEGWGIFISKEAIDRLVIGNPTVTVASKSEINSPERQIASKKIPDLEYFR